MLQTAQNNSQKTEILSSDKTQAIHTMIRITQNMIHMAERESQTLIQNDFLSFAIMQDEKNLLTEHYVRASEEFRAKATLFRGIEKSLIAKLETVQKQLYEITSNNNLAVAEIYERANTKTQSALLMAQEFGQQRVRYDNQANNNRQTTGSGS